MKYEANPIGKRKVHGLAMGFGNITDVDPAKHRNEAAAVTLAEPRGAANSASSEPLTTAAAR